MLDQLVCQSFSKAEDDEDEDEDGGDEVPEP